ncbi:MAG: hypothetical protein K1X67_14595 [Fimbriimonadaceae bacterium]|nr:hypothetical protein [Fimbriimonadaceae bacterium]
MKLPLFLAMAMATLVQASAQITFSGTIDLAASGVEAPVAGTPYEFWVYNWDQGGSSGVSGGFTLGAGGTYSFTVSGLNELGTYRVFFRSDFVTGLGKLVEVDLQPLMTNIAIPTWSPYLGDFEPDNEISIGDFSYLSDFYNTWIGHPQYDAYYDLNKDGYIDAMDYSIFASNYGMAGDDNGF